ncbi:Protein kinase domain - like 10, partial [Theobroma cacao]
MLNLSQNNLMGSVPRGNQFDTFTNDSYIGNLRLCVFPLSKECGESEGTKLPPSIFDEDDDYGRTLTWKCAMIGLSGLLTPGLEQLMVLVGLRNLQSLSLEGNKLEGSIPAELCHLNSLGFLDLAGNKLVGPIPACLGDLISLRHLLLDRNKFTDSIPSTLTRLVDILQLNMSSNTLRGALPIDIEKWKVVNNIDISKNQLLGEIPKSIGDVKDLTYLSLFGNKLQGSIPESFGGSKGLNNFFGIIPKPLEKLLYLEYFNVYFNRLQGEIPDGGTFPNYSIRSFMANKALCATPRLHLPLPPCKTNSFRHHSKKAIKLVEYILVPVGSTVLVLALTSIESFKFSSTTLVIHCDLKPSNVLLDEDMVAHLGDFGIAKLLGEKEDSATHTMTLATIRYMAP